MDTLLAVVFLVSAAAVIPVFVAAIYCSYSLNRYLKQSHPQIWAEIAPHPAAEPTLSSPVSRFVTQRRYRAVQDDRVRALGDRCFRLLYLAGVVFLLLVLSGLSYDLLS